MMVACGQPRTPPRRAGGAVTIEFFIVAAGVFIPLVLGVLQMGMLMMAKNTVNLAALSVARAGAASGGDAGEMRRAYASALAPLYASAALNANLTDVNYPAAMTATYARALIEVATPLTSYQVLNPTPASFRDFGVTRNGVRVIPVTGLDTSNGVGASSRQRRSDALLLKIQVRHCYRLVFPIIDRMIIGTLRRFNVNAGDQMCYAANGVPIQAQGVVRMTVPPRSNNFR